MLATALVGAPGTASAQDYPTYKGDAQRSGKGSLYNTSGPGTAKLTWYRPNWTDNVGKQVTIDNIFLPNPNTDPAYVTETGIWASPTDNLARNFYEPTDIDAPQAGVQYPAQPPRPPAYRYAEAIASATGTDPRQPLNPGDPLSTFTWSLRDPVAPFYGAHNYAIYVNLPIGDTTVGGIDRSPQREYVFEIRYSGGTYIDVVDTAVAAAGPIRLGNGGLPTDMIFPSDGVNPIQVVLYNTVPRDPSTGVLTTNPAAGSNDLDLTQPRPLVYADAVEAVPVVGFYAASPIVSSFTGLSGPQFRTVAALNEVSVGLQDGKLKPSRKGVATSYDHNTGLRRWIFSPLEESSLARNMDNLSAGVTVGTAWAPPAGPPIASNFRGTNYLTTSVDPASASSSVVYDPEQGSPMNPGSYDIYVWIPGNSNGTDFAQALQYEVHEGATTTLYTLDQSGATQTGWVRIGTRRFLHDPNGLGRLTLEVTNYSADAADATRMAFTDAVRFVGPSNMEISSTPLQVTARIRMTRNGTPEDHAVTIIAAENGVIYCLDATGRGDGTTDVLWTYPSTRDPDIPEPAPGSPDTWKDPNLNPPDATNTDWGEIDGVAPDQRIAQMPEGFDLSSASVARIDGEDYLFIGATNGRVYCIEMAGRGDFNTGTRHAGTTRRVWTYPDDYPAAAKSSQLGQIAGSIAVNTNGAGLTTVYVPTTQGRMYALDAKGNALTHTTTVRWTYPAMTDPTLGPIIMTPAVDFGKVYFGTLSKDGTAPGQFMALDADTGNLAWTMPAVGQPLSDFLSGPATVPGTDLGGGMTDTVFVANDNRGVYALDASSGALEWENYEVGQGPKAPLTYTVMSVPDGFGGDVSKPIIVVPEADGVISFLNAQTNDLTNAGTRIARGLDTHAQGLNTNVAIGWNFMYIADLFGKLTAWSNTAGVFPPGETPPVTEVGGGNSPGYADYAGAKFKLIKQSAFNMLRQGSMYYADALDPANEIVRSPMAFEWGETMYMLIYNFPYKRSGTTVPPVINVNFAVGGQTLRNVFTEARIFPGDSDPNTDGNQTFADTDPFGGYAVLSFAIQGAGPNALTPGPGQISIGFNTSDGSGQPVNFPASMTQPFYVANPLGLIIPSPGGADQSIGNTNVASDPQNLANGSGSVPNLLGTLGSVGNGQSSDLQIGVLDRSLMSMLTHKGLNNIRVERADLAWQPGLTPAPGSGLVLKPIDAALFPNFEDLPVNYPNNSLDYPDIRREAVTVVKSAQGESENPVGYNVGLEAPLAPDGSMVTEATAATRVLNVTPFDLTLAVPRYQPANESIAGDANGTQVPAGYSGTYFVFVDSSGNGKLDRPGGIQTDPLAPSSTREAYRNFMLSAGVPPDQRIAVLTQTVDLGPLAEGAGYTPGAPGPGNALFDPWTGSYTPMFKPFEVANEGNVNLLNLRLAKATTDGSTTTAWQILSPANEDLAYLDGDYDLWSDLDPQFAPMKDITPAAPVILQKARVGDRSPRHLSPNPLARINNNLGVITPTPRLPEATYPIGAPKVAVSIPFGFPVGTYTGVLRVIEDGVPGNDPAAMALDENADGPTEIYSEPGLKLVFKARETRLTSSFSTFAAPMLDNLSNGSENFRFSNLQPTGFRNPTNGGFVAAFASNRPDWATADSATAPVSGAGSQWRIYLGSVQGVDPLTAPGTSPLRDLDAFVPDTTNGRWFVQSPVTANGFPAAGQDATVFDVNGAGGESLVAGTVKYGSPVFPSSAMMDPFRDPATGVGTVLPNATMAFVGEAQVQTPNGRVNDSRIFVAPVTVDGTGAVGVGNIFAMTNDPQAAKGRPSIVQTPNSFILFYAATVAGRSSIYYVMPSGVGGAGQYDGSYFGDSAALDLGTGFESTWSPSVIGRLYRGINGGIPSGIPVLEISFAGKLRGRPMSEIYYGRIGLDGGLAPTGLLALPTRTRERLVAGGAAGTYLAEGVSWISSPTISLEIFAQGTMQDIELPNTRVTDRETGIISFNTRLGGKAYLDPAMGTVRLSGANPAQASSLYLTYQPRLLRVSEGTSAGYAGANVAFDQRLIPDLSYWHRGGDASSVDNTDPVRNDRMVFTYNRAAAGAGQAARPMLKTMRLGIDLPFAIFTDANGNEGPVSVAKGNVSEPGNIQYFQVDPAKKRVYFTGADEDRTVTVTYQAADEATGQSLGTKTWTARVGWVTERTEELMQLDQAANETNLSMFLDPFDSSNLRRPGLIWLLWSSTRTGAPDVYMQTIAPKFTPVVPSK